MRYVFGTMYAVIALIFLTVNSYILGSFGAKYGDGYWASIGFAAVAGSVPWALAPHLHVMAAKRKALYAGRRRNISSVLGYWFKSAVSAVPFLLIYVVFVIYNVVGGTGATAYQRVKLADDRKAVIDETDRFKSQRSALQAQLDGIPKHRPPAAVEPLLEATKLHVFWKRTKECTESVTNRGRRDYCAEVASLKAELANAVAADKVIAEIRDLDARLGERGRETSTGDPQVQFLANMTGLNEGLVFMLLLISTPVALEIGALYWGKQAMDLFRLHIDMSDHEMIPVNRQIAPAPVMPPRPGSGGTVTIEPVRLEAVNAPLRGEDPRRMRAVFDEFWSHYTRPLEGAQVSEAALYEHYRTLCQIRDVSAFPMQRFRVFSADKIDPSHCVSFSGQVWYQGIVFCDEVTA
ncbi:MAG: hypothetical protein KDI55_00180 [Anaerolineae bacterium]|nr:hypothetical protein [Anaerolineae bacterium]